MTRKKVKLAYITNDSARKATFKKRKKGLMKKVSELSTLCGIDATAIIYSPYDSQPEVWPPGSEFRRIVARFKGLPEMDQSKKMMNQEGFLRQRIAKAHEQLKKQRRDNREKEVTQVMFQGLIGKSLNNLNMVDLNDLAWIIDQNLKEINKRTEDLKTAANEAEVVPASVQLPPPPPSTVGGVVRSGGGEQSVKTEVEVNMEAMQRQSWFVDLVTGHDQHVGFGGNDEVMFPFGDNNPHALWSNAFYP